MVDLRPLLFLNALVVMLFFTAGFAHVRLADVSEMKADTAVAVAKPAPADLAKTTAPAAPAPQDPPKASIQEDASIFADVGSAKDSNAAEQMAANLQAPAQPAEQPLVVAALDPAPAANAPAVAAPSAQRPVTESKPKVQLPPEPVVGKLTVRSNVTGDKVRINGREYGSTMLELELEPGEYLVEVTKPGYKGWTQAIMLAAGSQSVLHATLEQLTTVEYRHGTWKHGVVTGEGTYLAKDGTKYEGGFLDRRFHGKGKLILPDGTTYDGEWREGKKEGFGHLSLPNGDRYVGHFRDDDFSGEGTLTKSNGDIYAGIWLNGKLNGEGSLTTKQGLMYVGGFIENEFSGTGEITYPDGTHYQGGFSKNLFHGQGMLTYRDGKKYTGQFLEGKFHGKGELQNPNGSKISGTFKFGKPYGQATLTTPEGEVFTARSNEPGVCYRLKSYRATQCPPMEGW